MQSTSQDSSIAAELRDDILRGRYRVGERLPSERDLAQRFGVHRSTVRAAFRRLEQLGVAVIQPGGARVAPLEEASLDIVEHLLALDDPSNPEIVDQALEAMSGFRAMVTRLATERASEEQRARMLTILESMMNPDVGHDELANLVEELGDIFVEASGNMVLRLMEHGLRSQREGVDETHPFPTDTESPATQMEPFNPDLRRLARAIEDSDGATASECVYQLSCQFRARVRQRSTAAISETTPYAAEGGARR